MTGVSHTEKQLDSLDLMLNMGPQHPSTHGVFRLLVWIDGERIVRAEPHIGYLHRGAEKLCEDENYAQIITLFDRFDYIANLNSELAFCLAVEKLMDLEIPERAEYIRVILCELNRIANHMLFYGVYGLDIGAMTPILYGFRERERIQSLFESVTGARMMHNYIRIGGVKQDLPDDFDRRMADAVKLVVKEDILPSWADRRIYWLAPLAAFIPAFMLWVTIPVAQDLVLRNLELGLFYIAAVSVLSLMGLVMAGWGSANKYAVLGGPRGSLSAMRSR